MLGDFFRLPLDIQREYQPLLAEWNVSAISVPTPFSLSFVSAMTSRFNLQFSLSRRKFDYFTRSLADIFAPAPDLTPYDPIISTQDLNEKNPPNTAAARLSESPDLSAPDRVNDQLYNRILWLMLKGDTRSVAPSHAALHALQSSK